MDTADLIQETTNASKLSNPDVMEVCKDDVADTDDLKEKGDGDSHDAEKVNGLDSEDVKPTQHQETAPGVENDSKEDSDKKEGWIFVLGHDKLRMKALQPGLGPETRPAHGQVVTVRCVGKLADGTRFDEFEKLKFTVGDGDVVQGKTNYISHDNCFSLNLVLLFCVVFQLFLTI